MPTRCQANNCSMNCWFHYIKMAIISRMPRNSRDNELSKRGGKLVGNARVIVWQNLLIKFSVKLIINKRIGCQFFFHLCLKSGRERRETHVCIYELHPLPLLLFLKMLIILHILHVHWYVKQIYISMRYNVRYNLIQKI